MKTDNESMEFQILEAAEKLFLEQGYAKTTTGQIAKLAGCNQALVHYYYRTKDNLFDKIFEEKVRLVASKFLTVDSMNATLEEKITNLVNIHFDFLKRNPKLVQFIINEITSNPERLQTLANKLQNYPKTFFEKLEIILKKEIEEGTIHPISSTDLMLTIVSLNMTPFLLAPMMQAIMNLSDKEIQEMQEHRKLEIIKTVLSRLRK